ncbi:PmoA family protein [candidate division KSB1 bacterium]|nr:PmoA family protein [candidate division KSB1 bacterium]
MKPIYLFILFTCVQPGFCQLTVDKHEDGYWVRQNGKDIMFYQTQTKSLDGKYPRSNYIHPLYSLDGEIITEDFPPDHPHHRGVFWAWHQVIIGDSSLGDSWECRNISYGVETVKIARPDSQSVTLAADVMWRSPLWLDDGKNIKPFIRENTLITIYKTQQDYRILTFQIELQAMEDSVKIGGSKDEKGYGGFSVRTPVPDDLIFVSQNKHITPKNNAIQAGPWMDFSGTFVEKKCGITIFTHPDNPGLAQNWIIRGGQLSKSMQNAMFPGREPVVIPTIKPVILKYAVVIHRGDASTIDLGEIYQTYVERQ